MWVFFLASGTLLPDPASAEEGHFQIDVLFPKPEETYAPVYPFPIVLAVHNISTVWKDQFQLEWSIAKASREGAADHTIAWWPVTQDEQLPTGFDTKTDPPPDTWLLINSTDQLAPSVFEAGKYRFFMSAVINFNCSVPPFDPQNVQFNDNGVNSSYFYFNVAAEGGKLPDVTAIGECAEPRVGLGINGTVPFGPEYYYPDDNAPPRGYPCPILSNPNPPLQECAYRVSEEDQKKVVEEMLVVANCTGEKGVEWPSSGLTELCGSASEATRNHIGGVSGAVLLVACFLVCVTSFAF
jgi:hypothetical protein